MKLKNKAVLGLPNFIKEFYQDCKQDIATGWWNEKTGRRGERLNLQHNDNTLKTTCDVINYIKDNANDISEEDIVALADKSYSIYPKLSLKRVYTWEVSVEEESPKEEVAKEEVIQEETPEKEDSEKETPQEDSPVEDKPVPDFDFAKKIEDRKELKEYAQGFGFKLDSRKSLPDMMKSFQGKFHASKNK